MERRFFMNDFEQSLKEQADQFQMIPSKKVWHGIYNDLHPGRKWPSIAMSLSLIFTLVVIGHMHVHNQDNLVANTKNVDEIVVKSENSNQVLIKKNNPIAELTNHREKSTPNSPSGKELNNSNQQIELAVSDLHDNLSNQSSVPASTNDNNLNSSFEKNSTSTDSENKNADTKKVTQTIYDKELSGVENYESLSHVINAPVFANINFDKLNTDELVEKATDKSILINEQFPRTKNIDKASENNSASDVKVASAKIQRKRDEKINWVYYAAPMVNTVSFSGEFLKEVSNTNFTPVLLRVNQKENKVIHNSALGFEAGAQMNYLLSKRLKFKTGVHLTYSGYNIISNQVHPTVSSLVLKDPATGMTYENSYFTHYGDGTGLAITTLHNYSLQASIPLGLQYAFYDNSKLQFSLAADIEPSFLLKGNSFILSSNGNNYVNDPSLLRKWNFNSNFGTFVTFSSPKFHWQIGPNLRYQWLSTYQKNYTVKEHLINYGIRIGISKNR